MNERSSNVWYTLINEKRWTGCFFGWRVSFSIYPILLTLFHTALFLWLNPRLDLPIYDDANFIAYAKLFSRGLLIISGDWSPLLVYFAALLYRVLPLEPVPFFAVYTFICQWIFLLGTYYFINRFTSRSGWAFAATVLISIVVSYSLNLNGHLFPAGLFMMLVAWAEKRSPLNVYASLALLLIAALLRIEYTLIAAGLALRYVFLFGMRKTILSFLKPTLASIFVLLLIFLFWVPVLWMGTLSSGRFLFAFEQKFSFFAHKEGLYSEKNLPENAHWSDVTSAFFPQEKRTATPLDRLTPLASIASANPDVFRQFLEHNAKPFLRFDFPFSESQALSSFVSLFIQASLSLLLILIVFQRRKDLMGTLYFSLVFAGSVLPCLVTMPDRYYIFPAIVWFLGVLPSVWLLESRYWKAFVTALILSSIFHQYLDWQKSLNRMQAAPNRARARLLELASKNEGFHSCTVAEAHPLFSVAFSNCTANSVSYNVGWDENGILRLKNECQAAIDYILLEKPPEDHPFADIQFLDRIVKLHGEMIAEYRGYSMWKVFPIRVIVTDDALHNEDLCGGKDIDFSDNRQIAIRWNLDNQDYVDYHIWVIIDGQEKQYLGRSAGGDKNNFIWNETEEWVDERFKSGPQFGHVYEFVVYGMPKDRNLQKPKAYYCKGSIEYQEGK